MSIHSETPARYVPASRHVKPEGASMWVSRRTDYATRAVLAQVMPVLRAAGIVRSTRGPEGGYRLNNPAEQITLERVVRLFEGQLAPIGYATRHNPDPCPEIAGSLRDTWAEVRDATIEILAATTFADLAAGARRSQSD